MLTFQTLSGHKVEVDTCFRSALHRMHRTLDSEVSEDFCQITVLPTWRFQDDHHDS
jgi:hypothetical protein